MKDFYLVSPLATIIFVTLLSFSAQKEYLNAETDVCRLFKNDTILRKPGVCTDSIKCVNHKSVDLGTCTGWMQTYRPNIGECVKPNPDTYCEPPCVKSSPTYVVDPTNCKNWFECRGSYPAAKGSCNEGLVFDQKSQLCVYPSQSTCEATYEICDIASNTGDTPFMDEENCHKYFTCVEKNKLNVQIENTCVAGTYYDVDLGECKPKEQVQCNKHPYPDGVCDGISNRFISDDVTCRGYFYCSQDATPQWNHCSELYFFNEEKQACMDKALVKCDKDRCDGIVEGKIISGRPGCQHYLICENNKTVEEVQCPQGNYYDPYMNTCTNQIQSYIACKS